MHAAKTLPICRGPEYAAGMRSVLIASALIIALTLPGSIRATAPPIAPRVTVIADSALTAVVDDPQPLAILTTGLATDFDIGVCRRLTGTSCPSSTGVPPPTLVDVVQSLGPRIAPTVIVEVGYNEFVDTFPASVEMAITTLLAAGVTKILWTTMAEMRLQYIGMNQQLVAAASHHPEVELVDWASASRGHDAWFQPDGVHLTYDGARAIAHLLHDAVVRALVPPLVLTPTRLPVAHVGKPYSAQLTARGGQAPYRWQLTSGPLTDGLRVLAGGRILGTPRRSGKLVLTVRATDAVAQAGSLKATVTVSRN